MIPRIEVRMSTELDGAVRAARAAGELLRANAAGGHALHFKGEINFATEIDRQAERLISEMLRGMFPGDGVLGEEETAHNRTARRRWVVDPIDGTTNFARGYPLFAVSVGLEEDGQAVVGAVYNPLLDELFAAEAGKGATLNGARIHVSTTDSLGRSLLACGFPYSVWQAGEDNLAQFGRLMKRTLAVRNDGSAALDLCHVACGRLDGCWEQELEPWDVCAAGLIVEEAGGRMSLYSGEQYDLYGRSMAGSNGILHEALLAALHEG